MSGIIRGPRRGVVAVGIGEGRQVLGSVVLANDYLSLHNLINLI